MYSCEEQIDFPVLIQSPIVLLLIIEGDEQRPESDKKTACVYGT